MFYLSPTYLNTVLLSINGQFGSSHLHESIHGNCLNQLRCYCTCIKAGYPNYWSYVPVPHLNVNIASLFFITVLWPTHQITDITRDLIGLHDIPNSSIFWVWIISISNSSISFVLWKVNGSKAVWTENEAKTLHIFVSGISSTTCWDRPVTHQYTMLYY